LTLRGEACEKCGAVLAVGDFPFCPHGSSRSVVIGDDVPGGFIAENGFKTPRVFYSKKAHRDALAAEGKEIVVKYAGDGYEKQGITNWAAGISQHQLDSAKALLERGAQARTERLSGVKQAQADFPITVTPWTEQR
jgi:hypothetical protein